jgi:hypothetical protein
MLSSRSFAQWMDLSSGENTSEYKTIELINMDKDLSTFANLPLSTQYFFSAYHRTSYTLSSDQ